jgi:hypothetical protein
MFVDVLRARLVAMNPNKRDRPALLPRALLFAAALAVLSSCSTQQALDVALAKDPKATVKAIEQSKLEAYKRQSPSGCGRPLSLRC